MEYALLINLLNGIASEFMILGKDDIDVPSAGKFFNQLDNVIKEAETLKIGQITEVARASIHILEKIILDAMDDKEAGLSLFEKGISLMQEITERYENTGTYQGNVREFIETVFSPTGEEIAKGTEETVPPCPQEEGAAEEKFQIEDESLLKDFITEALEYIEQIEINILNLEQNSEDKNYINAVFRPFHSIKGVAGFLNLEGIRDLSHNLEDLLDKVRSDELPVTPQLIDIVLDGADALKTMIGQLKDNLEGKGGEPFEVDTTGIESRIKQIEEHRFVEEVPKVKKVGEILMDDGIITEDVLEESLKIAQVSPGKKIGEALISEGKITPKQLSQALRKQADRITDTATIRVDIGKLDDLIDMVGELVITQSMIQEALKNQLNTDRNLMRNISQFFRITSELQRVSTGLRMIPIKQTFQRISRLVRDLAKDAGKLVAVEMQGEETEIDRNMVDEIYNPIVHMIRNSVDHGIEMPGERVKLGKPEQGLIRLKAYHRGGNIIIEISDDGRGLGKEKILEKAIKNGIINSADSLTDQDIFRLIFLPGLSTAKAVTDVSGRGVGMDVVKQAVEKLRGKIEIESLYGNGTTFMVSFPLTMAIIDGIILKVGTEYYILPTMAIRQMLRPSRDIYNNIIGKGETINVMGQLLPLVKLYDLFHIKPECRDPWEGIVAVVDGDGRSKCLLVDKIIGKAEVVIKSLGDGLKNIKGVSAGAILGDGNVGLILDPEGLFELSEERSTIPM
ncbi:MAG: chemotaxis protein CheA [Deltaproteobacteria bacterium]|nr:MAG: chemotaxis protein CheA [Deltaproteobacteria bacterium]